MSDHHATLHWARTSDDFTYNTYNRAHEIRFKDGAVVVPSSAAPEFKGDAGRVDPEEAFVGSLSSCHMLTFLAVCARKRLAVDAYDDEAVGTLEKGPNGKLWMGHVTLRPRVRFAPGVSVDKATLDEIHHRAHEECFIALSVKTEVAVEPEY
ncbi:MAG TPA: OsmC family protein [Rhizomicrobium sp.]|nr:OsmC family protein [Rhizomicrobium sp.]